jgi:hypothetical protein
MRNENPEQQNNRTSEQQKAESRSEVEKLRG